MKKNLKGFILTLWLLSIAIISEAAILKGTVIDKSTQEPLIGASVQIKGTTMGTITDMDGHFELKDLKNGQYTLIVSYVSFRTQEINVQASENTSDLFVFLEADNQSLSEVTITARKNLEGERTLQLERKQSTVAIENLGAKEMSIKGISNVEEGVKKITGISIASAGQLIVRGLGDRYSITTLNGLAIASPNPDNKLIPFDLFPTSTVQNITVSKVYDAASFADYSGAHINISTKEYVTEDFLHISLNTGGAFNTLGKDRYQMDRNGTLFRTPAMSQKALDMPLQEFDNYAATHDIFRTSFSVNKKTALPALGGNISLGKNYKVGEQTPVDAVASIPQTNPETPTEVQIGSKIQLYSPTDGVEIYYTLDGSEPALTPENKYNGAQGIIVPEPDNSSLFTITAVAYKEGLAVSEISRLVFAYPGAVSSPYANPISGAVTENTEVILKSATEDAVIYYEIAYGDKAAAEPTTASEVFDASNPIVISQKANIKAIAVKNSITSSVSSFTYTVSDKLAIPTPSIDTGAVITSGTVISLKADDGATIYYTLDGSNPKDSANKAVQVGSQVVINAEAGELIMLRTYAAKNGFTDSDAGTYSYSISAYAAGIYADREDGATVKNGDEIYLHPDMSDAEIYYTLDGSAPTIDSHRGSTITVDGEPGEQFTIMAMAVADGSEKSNAFATFTYTIMNKLAAPTASVPDNAIFTKESIVELTAESEKIYYTTDGSDPTTASNLYKKSIIIDGPVTIKAIAVADDLETSDISTFTYGFADKVAAPIASYASGELEMGTKVTFSSETEGATIYYRTDGKDINLSRKNELEIYKEPITINQATNFKVIAVKDKMQDSNILKVGYTVKEPIVIEAVEEEETQNLDNQSNRLQSRRSFSDTESGPSYKDVVLRNASYGAIVAAEEGVLPEQVQLLVESTNVTDAIDRRVKQVISESFGVVASYDVTLLVNGEEAQPEGTIEIGLPIPVEYENAMIYIIHVQEDGNIELFETRRSGGVAYAKVDHLSVFSITAPVEFEEENTSFPWLPVAYTLAVGLTGLGIWLIYKSKKQRREDGM